MSLHHKLQSERWGSEKGPCASHQELRLTAFISWRLSR